MEEEKLYSNYLRRFESCINSNKPLTRKEIYRLTKIDKTTFSKVYLSNLSKLGLIIILPKGKENKRALKKFLGQNWDANTRGSYYFFTIETSKITIEFNKLMSQVEPTIKEKEKFEELIIKKDKIISLLKEYELLICARPKFEGADKIKKEIELSEQGKSIEQIEDFFKKNKTGLLSSIENEKSLINMNKGKMHIVIDKSQNFKKLKEMIDNFTITGKVEKDISKPPISLYPIVMEKMYYIKSQFEDFVTLLKANIF